MQVNKGRCCCSCPTEPRLIPGCQFLLSHVCGVKTRQSPLWALPMTAGCNSTPLSDEGNKSSHSQREKNTFSCCVPSPSLRLPRVAQLEWLKNGSEQGFLICFVLVQGPAPSSEPGQAAEPAHNREHFPGR